MSEAEKLPKNQPAEIHIDGIPQYAGEISATLEQGLLMSDTRSLLDKQIDADPSVHKGARGDLIFTDLFDEEGTQQSVPVTIVSSAGTAVTLDFFDQDSEVTNTVLRLLKTRKKPGIQSEAADGATLAELRKRSLKQLDKIIGNFLVALADYLFEMSSRPQIGSAHEDFYEAMNALKQAQEPMCKVFTEQMEAFFEDTVKKGEQAGGDDEGEIEISELNLVDIQDFEDSLSVNRIIRMGQDKYSIPLECLVIRYAELIDAEPLDTRLPMHVAQICLAFQECMSGRGVPSTAAPDVYVYFSDQVIRKLDPFYTTWVVCGGPLPAPRSLLPHSSPLFAISHKRVMRSKPSASISADI